MRGKSKVLKLAVNRALAMRFNEYANLARQRIRSFTSKTVKSSSASYQS